MASSFGRWILGHRAARIGLIACLLPLPLTSVLSAGIVVAVAISRSWREAVIDCVMALLLLLAITVFAGGIWTQVAASATSTWFAAILLGILTGAYGSLTLTLQVLIVLGVAALLAFVFASDDPVAFWEDVLSDFVVQMNEVGVEFGDPEALLQLAPMMSGVVVASVVSSCIMALLIGAWWASSSGGPGFRDMFVRIKLGYVVGGIAVLAGLATLFLPGELAANILLVLGVGFVFQGLAVVHWLVGSRGLPWMYLIPVYLPFFMGASISVVALFLLASVGFTDNWYDLRRAGRQGS